MKIWILRGLFTITACVLLLIGFAYFTTTKDRGPGAYSPGFKNATITVQHRKLPLDVFVWYPTDEQNATQLLGQNALFYGEHVQAGAKPKTGKHPLIVFSHGSGGNAYQSAWLAQALVERGYAVIAANHPGTTSRDSLPERTVMIWERAKDLSALIDWAQSSPIDALTIDATKIAAMGFSLGGHSALAISGLQTSKKSFVEYCDKYSELWDCDWLLRGDVDFSKIDADQYEANYGDVRVKATIAIDPALAHSAVSQSAANINHPVLLVNFQPPDGIPVATDASPIASAIPNATYTNIPESWHFGFLPECSRLGKIVLGLSSEDNICSDEGLRSRKEIHQNLIKIIVPFIEQSLPILAK